MFNSKTKAIGLSVALAAIVLTVAVSANLGVAADAPKVDPNLSQYKKVSGVSGNISSVGSDSMNNLMTLWCEGFAKYYPNVRCQIEGKGSSTAPTALIAGTAQIGPMSRAMKGTEKDEFEKKFGYKPTEIRTSIDSLAVYVNKDNPLECLAIKQVDSIFSKTRKCGATDGAGTWGDVGLSGDWAGRPLSIYGRNSASGTYGFFKETALCKGDYKDEVKEQPGSASVVQGVTEDRFGVGYSGIGYRTSGVKAISLAKDGKACAEPNLDNVLNGSYPLGRYLYVYINKTPNKSPEPLVKEFLKFVLSKEGQLVVVKDGYDPMPATIAAEEIKKIDSTETASN
ncbi:MAG: PstS family phosphate ABC transporter substrate-binding protein [Deltaproteobacteria bacterium]